MNFGDKKVAKGALDALSKAGNEVAVAIQVIGDNLKEGMNEVIDFIDESFRKSGEVFIDAGEEFLDVAKDAGRYIGGAIKSLFGRRRLAEV